MKSFEGGALENQNFFFPTWHQNKQEVPLERKYTR